VGIQPLDSIDDTARFRLRRLDALLDALEELNLSDRSFVPVRLGTALEDFGVPDPYSRSVTELIDRVFELQEPLLSCIRQSRWWRA
jgi:hypothetical protein